MIGQSGHITFIEWTPCLILVNEFYSLVLWKSVHEDLFFYPTLKSGMWFFSTNRKYNARWKIRWQKYRDDKRVFELDSTALRFVHGKRLFERINIKCKTWRRLNWVYSKWYIPNSIRITPFGACMDAIVCLSNLREVVPLKTGCIKCSNVDWIRRDKTLRATQSLLKKWVNLPG